MEQCAAIRFPYDAAPNRIPPILQTERSELHFVHWSIHRSDDSRIRENQAVGKTIFAIRCVIDIAIPYGGQLKLGEAARKGSVAKHLGRAIRRISVG